MRYYECTVDTTVEKIEKNAKIRLKDYDYDSPVAAVNKYIYRNIVSNVQFFLYREEGRAIRAVFCYHEDKMSFRDAVRGVCDALDEAAGLRILEADCGEITTYQYIDCLLEAKRRGLCGAYNYLDESNDFIYEGINRSEINAKFGFTLDEMMVSSSKVLRHYMYDQSLLDEINNITHNANKTEFAGNMVHYIISGKSKDAAIGMMQTLLQSLEKAHRISSRRIEIVSDMDPFLFKRNDTVERLITGNKGGAIVFDMTERLGIDPIDYKLCCQYIEKLVKKYKNDCLFIFIYNTDNPGFSYSLLPLIQKHVALVKIKEAKNTKEKAVLYLQDLIKNSQYSKYAKQAGEFFESFPGNQFTQTDVLEAFEKFEPWCINRNSSNAYSYGMEEEFWLDRDEDTISPCEKLEKLIGLNSVKDQINKILVTDLVERERKQRVDTSYPAPSMHMIFSGNPGTAKTTVAKLFAGIAKEKGILKSGAFVERGGTDYATMGALWTLKRDFEAAKGGVLFIDEAYAIQSETVVSLLIKEMENRRDEVIVVLAGYEERMQGFLNLNEGLKSRIPYWVDFPDYSTEELGQIMQLMADERGFKLTEDAMKNAMLIFDKVRYLDNFGNGRFARNLIEKAIQNQSVRLSKDYGEIKSIPKETLFLLTGEDMGAAEEGAKVEKEVGTAKKELDEMIGIESAKKIIQKAIATFRLKKLYVDKGIQKDRPSMHMVFTGNPGTAKTTTARLVAEILRDEKILPSGKFVEVGRADLVGRHVGATAPLVKQRFREAQGGVLFIDEAYSLCDGSANSYGDEAINTIVQEMENHREDVIVIFAGYPREMQQFLDRNPGMASRIAFQVEFEDYSVDELCEIATLMLKRKDLHITDDAMKKLRDICEQASKENDYGNGRYVRKLLEEAEMNLAQRLSVIPESELALSTMTTIEACDIEDMVERKETCSPIGFRAS